MKLNDRQKLIIETYRDQVKRNRVNHGEIAKKAGLRGASYVSRMIQLWRQAQAAPKGEQRECLCCCRMFVSAGAHNRLCDLCRASSSYVEPYQISPSLHCAAAGRY
jgi:hypothetical protein